MEPLCPRCSRPVSYEDCTPNVKGSDELVLVTCAFFY